MTPLYAVALLVLTFLVVRAVWAIVAYWRGTTELIRRDASRLQGP